MYDTKQGIRDEVLTNVLLAYPQTGFIAEEILPTVNVDALTGVAYKFDNSSQRTPESTEREGLARAQRVDFNLTEVAFGPLKEHSLEIGIPEQVMKRYKSPLAPETNATNNISKRLKVEKEVLVRDFITDAAKYPTSNKTILAGTAKFSDNASDPVGVFQTARTAVQLGCGNAANFAVVPQAVIDRLKVHPQLVDRIRYAARVSEAEMLSVIADIMGVQKIYVGSAVQNSAKEGLADSRSFIWAKDVVFGYKSEVPAIEELSFGYLLQLEGETYVDKWYEQERKAQFIRANDFYLPWAVAYEAAYLVKDAL